MWVIPRNLQASSGLLAGLETMGIKRKYNPRHPNWAIWHGMKQRCDCPGRKDYKYYGGRGIAYDPSWAIFANFNRDMGVRPTPDHTLDRKKNDEGYSKSNCRWATRTEQVVNSRMVTLITHDGVTQPIAAWCRTLGLKRSTVGARMARGSSAEKALGFVL